MGVSCHCSQEPKRRVGASQDSRDTKAGSCAPCSPLPRGHLQRSPVAGVSSTAGVPELVHQTLANPGRPLDALTRRTLEPRFGHDFGAVRVHDDAQAGRSAGAIGALAYTVGSHVVLDRQRLPDRSYARQRAVAHELAHVAQQSAVSHSVPNRIDEDSRSEAEADDAARLVMRGRDVRIRQSRGSGLRRLPRSMSGSVDPDSMTEDEIATEIAEIDAQLQIHALSDETYEHLTTMRQALVAAQAGKGPRVTAPAAAKATAPYFGLLPADDAFSGIQLAYTVASLPNVTGTHHTFKVAPYLFALNSVGLPGGERRIGFYVAHRMGEYVVGSDTGWNEYIIGPDSIQTFLSNIGQFSTAGAVGYFGGPPAPYQAASGRVMQRLAEGNFGDALSAFGEAWTEAVQDPMWLAQMAAAGAGGVSRMPATKVPVKTPGLRSISTPGAGPVRMRPGPGGRPVVASPPRAPVTSGPTASAGPATHGANALKVQPQPTPAAVPVVQPGPVLVTTPVPVALPAPVAIAPGLATMTIASASLIRSSQEPVMATGLSPAEQAQWRRCKAQHDLYKATQGEAADHASKLNSLEQKLHQNTASPQETVDYCFLLDTLLDVVKRLHSERVRYVDDGCDKFDWFNNGTNEAERRASHEGELDNVSKQLQNLYANRQRFCP